MSARRGMREGHAGDGTGPSGVAVAHFDVEHHVRAARAQRRAGDLEVPRQRAQQMQRERGG